MSQKSNKLKKKKKKNTISYRTTTRQRRHLYDFCWLWFKPPYPALPCAASRFRHKIAPFAFIFRRPCWFSYFLNRFCYCCCCCFLCSTWFSDLAIWRTTASASAAASAAVAAVIAQGRQMAASSKKRVHAGALQGWRGWGGGTLAWEKGVAQRRPSNQKQRGD